MRNDIWFYIPGFNGYQINKEGLVRSMKMMYKNPGHILKKDKSGKEGNKGEKVKQESKNAEIVNEPANEKGKKEVEQNIKKETSSTTKEAPATPKEEKTKN